MVSPKYGVFIPPNRIVWPHELRVAQVLAAAGHRIEFLEEIHIHRGDILLDGVEFEIKSPITNKPDKLERNIKRALKQSNNVIFDSSRIQNMQDDKILKFLISKARQQKQIHRLVFISKHGQIIDIKSLI